MKQFFRDNFEKVLIALGILIAAIFTLTGNFIYIDGEFSPTILSYYGGFIGGTVGVFFSFAGYLIINKSFNIQKRQSFESLFFNSFKEFNEFRTKQIGLLYLPPEQSLTNEPRKLHTGYQFFETIFTCSLGFNEKNNRINYKTNKANIEAVFFENRSQMSHYFSHLNMLIYSVERAELNKNDKEFFLSYLKDQLSDQERFLVYYYKAHPDNRNFEFLESLKLNNISEIEKLVED
jgi:hypothetical protein